jgi:hypothetical protein
VKDDTARSWVAFGIVCKFHVRWDGMGLIAANDSYYIEMQAGFARGRFDACAWLY